MKKKTDKADKRPIVIIKKNGGHGGHHGGAWKVAYADFVTAMMAFFMVMWIMGMDQGAKDLIEGYFTNPVGFKKAYGGGKNPLAVGNTLAQPHQGGVTLLVKQAQEQMFKDAAVRMKAQLSSDELAAGLAAQIEITIDKEGLRIELLEKDENDSFFRSGSPVLRREAAQALAIIGSALSGLGNNVVLEGHTDAAHLNRSGYTNWELSSDRANTARRVLEGNGVAGTRIVEVRGYADRKPRIQTDPFAASNRRVTILLPYR